MQHGAVTGVVQAGTKNQADEQLFRTVFARAPVPQATVDLDATFMHVNAAACELIGYDEHELVGREFTFITHADSVTAAVDGFEVVANGEEETAAVRVALVHKDGAVVDAEITATAVRDDKGEVLYFVAVAQDLILRAADDQRYRHLAVHDALTELPNRAFFLERLDQAIRRAEREGSRLAVFFIDLDGFKAVNDRFGHQAGDELLFTLAGRLDRVVRPGDTVSRYGGDEFTILCEDLPTAELASEIAGRVLATLGRPVRVSAGEAQVSASVGVTLALQGDSPSGLLAAADRAMYAAKGAGKGTGKGTYRMLLR
jgi:diguanylate cyclase (GGDEF)-like protein/PAS domain S-box-containing protein